MIVYSVTINIKKEVETEWLEWMKEKHLKDVMATGYFKSYKIYRKRIPGGIPDETAYNIRYEVESFDIYEEYMQKAAPRLQQDHSNMFPGKFKASRAVYQQLDF